MVASTFFCQICHFPWRQNRRWLWAGARAGQHPEEQYDKQYPSRGAQHRDPPLSVRNKTFRRPPTNKPPPSSLSLEMRRDEERLEIICCCSTSSIVYISKWHHVEIVLILKSIQIQHRGGKDRFKRKINYCIKVFQNNKNITWRKTSPFHFKCI